MSPTSTNRSPRLRPTDVGDSDFSRDVDLFYRPTKNALLPLAIEHLNLFFRKVLYIHIINYQEEQMNYKSFYKEFKKTSAWAMVSSFPTSSS
ncbi:MAG: hypothetical protein K2H04_04775 [Bacteroidaceae bacterium]|nr:hypothetical protein [Bacteroidaceae bacterium]